MGLRNAFVRLGSAVALAAGLAGCQDRDVGTIRADRRSTPRPDRVDSVQPLLDLEF